MKIQNRVALCLLIIIMALAVKAQFPNTSDAEREQAAQAVIEKYVGELNPKAGLALDQKQNREAIAAASIVLAIAPQNQDALLIRAAAFKAEGQINRAKRDFERAIRFYPAAAKYDWQKELGTIAANDDSRYAVSISGNFVGSGFYQMVIDGSFVRSGNENSLESLVDYAAAAGYIKRAAAKVDDAYPQAWLINRLLDLNSAVLLDPGSGEALALRAGCFSAFSDQDFRHLAWRDATAALKANPKLVSAYTVRAAVLKVENNFPAALAELEKALTIDPNDQKALVNRGMINLELSKPTEGFRDLDRAVELHPKSWTYLMRANKLSGGGRKCQSRERL